MPYKRDNSVSPERRHWSASPPRGSADGAGPSKKRTTVNDVQRRNLDKLLQNPQKEVALPEPWQMKPLEAPPDMVKNISGSVSGAGSGEFHVYKASRRREFERLKQMQSRTRDHEEQAAFLERKAAMEAEADAKTAKNRNKRMKRKAGRKGGGAGAGGPADAAADGSGGGGGKRKLANGAVGGLGRDEPSAEQSDSDEGGDDAAPANADAEETKPAEPPKAVETQTVVHDED